jgi:hypothetical protein
MCQPQKPQEDAPVTNTRSTWQAHGCVYVLKDVASDWLITGHAQKFEMMAPQKASQIEDKNLWSFRIKAA